ERARILMRPGEYVVVSAASGVIVAAVLVAVTGQWLFAGAGMALAALAAVALPRRRIARRRKAFEAQLPEAMTLIASSLSAGHTFLRAIQMMCEEAEAPLSEEFARVVSETRLGDPVVDAIERMAGRLQIRDLQWVVQAIRIQQSVGGKLADLLHTLADFIRAREEVRREILALTAEGRISAWVLAARPVRRPAPLRPTSATSTATTTAPPTSTRIWHSPSWCGSCGPSGPLRSTGSAACCLGTISTVSTTSS